MCGIRLELPSQLADEHAEMLLLPRAVDAPDGLENRTVRNDSAHMCSEDGEELEFFRSQPDC